ncbi:TIGR04211 family SH3 domain-containing protein [Gallaecimonas sp. GXIMD4217]|uniref:TIGR04211 family SH3 domain-containing protein n=1 Tax=Gallaecimonas sp. GXIMD4217 TaxID=3131927 RepID=UPI00311B21D8
MLKRVLLACLALMAPVLMSTPAQAAEQAYISEDIFIYVHSGPSRQYRIIGSITAGEPVTVLERAEEFIKVKGADKEGWVESRYVTEQASFRITGPRLQQQLAQARAEIDRLSSGKNALGSELNDMQDQNQRLNAMVKQQSARIAELEAQVASMDQSNLMGWFLYGGGVAGGGLILGLLLPLLIPRKKRKDMWA